MGHPAEVPHETLTAFLNEFRLFPNGVSAESLSQRTGLAPETCIRYALSQPVSTLVVGMRSMDELKQNAAVARAFSPMPEDEQQTLRAQVKEVAGDGRYELFKSTKAFDGSHHRRQHGFSVG